MCLETSDLSIMILRDFGIFTTFVKAFGKSSVVFRGCWHFWNDDMKDDDKNKKDSDKKLGIFLDTPGLRCL